MQPYDKAVKDNKRRRCFVRGLSLIVAIHLSDTLPQVDDTRHQGKI